MTDSKYISRAGECNIRRFMSCNFDNDLSALIISGEPTIEELLKAWDSIITTYIDLSGQFKEMEEIEILRRKEFLYNRNQAVEMTIYAQRMSVDTLGEPFVKDFDVLIQNGYRPKWEKDIPKFLKQLKQFESAEASFHMEYKNVCEEIDKLKDANKDKKKAKASNRVNFLRMVNSLERFGNRIDFETTDVERLAIMISDYKELCSQAENESNKN